MEFSLSTADWVVGVGALVANLLLGLWLALRARQSGSSAEFFLAGRRLTWPIVRASLLATNIGAEHMVAPSIVTWNASPEVSALANSGCSATVSSSTAPSALLSQKATSGMRFGWRIRFTSCKARNSLRPSTPPRWMIFTAASAPPGVVAFHTSPNPPRPRNATSRYPEPGTGSSPTA